MKKLLVLLLVVLSISVFANDNKQTPIKPIKNIAAEKSVKKINQVDTTVKTIEKSNIGFFMATVKNKASNRSITSNWKAETILGIMLLLLGVTLVGRTKRKRAVSL